MQTLKPRFARIFAAGLIGATLTAPLAASAAPAMAVVSPSTLVNKLVVLGPAYYIGEMRNQWD